MRVCVIGAGVAGIVTAYWLARDGHSVTVVDRCSSPGEGASFANGSQLSYSYVAPLADPSVLRKLPIWVFRRDSPLRFIPSFEPDQWRWCIQFLGACRKEVVEQVTTELLAMGELSRTCLQDIVREEAVSFDHRRNGKLVVYRRQAELDRARRQMEYQQSRGCLQKDLNAADCVELEPALEQFAGLKGGIFTPSEEVGDCRKLTLELAKVLESKYRVTLQLSAEVFALRVRERRVVSARTSRGELHGDAFVVAAGVTSRELLRPLGIDLPIYPLGGYSLTVPFSASHCPPKINVTDADRKMVYAAMGNRLRIAGMVDVGTRKPRPSSRRQEQLLSWAKDTFPRGGDYHLAERWFGLRPATPRSTPIVGPTKYGNLLLNTGHGALGFTLACGSARRVADHLL